MPEIFRDRGEAGFRLAETSALRDLLSGSLARDSVVALGGGAFVQERNRELLRPWPTVFLDAPRPSSGNGVWRMASKGRCGETQISSRDYMRSVFRFIARQA